MKIKIDKFTIGENRTFIIAEIGNNHNGDFERAKLMVDKSVEMGADCAKFQMRQIKEVYRARSLKKSGEDLGTEYVIDLLNKFELTIDQHEEIAEYCKAKGILYLCTPWDVSSVDILESFNVAAYKVASADLTNIPLLNKLANTHKPLILSTGMSSTEEIAYTVDFLHKRKVDFVLLHCNSTYPAPVHDINLKWMSTLENFHPLVGYSGHERDINISLAAVALGAKIIERHFTLDRKMEGPDHAASLEFDEFKRMIHGCREIEMALGNNTDINRVVSQGEMINRENLGKSLVASRSLKKGTIISPEDISVKSPGQGLSPQNFELLIGKILPRDMDLEDFFFKSDIESHKRVIGNYTFKLPWGIPVRYHDFEKYNKAIKPDMFEFHLSYSDMELNIADFLSGTYECGFVLHAPELFQNSHLMDLATPNDQYRKISMNETQKVIDITRELKKYFPNEKTPKIVANIGGFSMDGTLPSELKASYYEQFFSSLAELDTKGVEIIPQTMAPFPWHFGGQRHQNIFVLVDEIVHYCDKYGLRMCFDVSHSMLTCNYFKEDFYDFAKRIAPYTAHIHIGDAKGLNGEGLQVGEGEMDFERLGRILMDGCPEASFIPEIWQGHKNDGEGFWIALEKLKNLL
jgi:N-acetylneuraminate synthase